MTRRCYSSFNLPRGAMGQSVVCNCDVAGHIHLLFCLCQTNKGGYLNSPRAQQTQDKDDYTMIVVTIPLFQEFIEIAIVLDRTRLDDGYAIEKNLGK